MKNCRKSPVGIVCKSLNSSKTYLSNVKYNVNVASDANDNDDDGDDDDDGHG